MTSKYWIPGIASLLALTLGACGINDVICTDEAVASINVAVVDSVSGDPVAEAVVWVEDGVFRDTLEGGGGSWFGPWERPGSYDVHVRHPGYEPWSVSGVTVEQGRCHIRPRSLTARLRASGL